MTQKTAILSNTEYLDIFQDINMIITKNIVENTHDNINSVWDDLDDQNFGPIIRGD